MVQNKALIFKKPPTGFPILGEHLVLEDRPFDLETEPPKDGITTRNCYISFDPYQRGRMRRPEIKSYFPPFDLDKPVDNSAICQVLKSANANFKPGDVIVVGKVPTEEYSVLDAEATQAARKLENPYNLDPALFIGPLGMTGLTAFSSLYEIGQPKKGEVILVSAASGAVGQIVGQLAKQEGLRVIGSVGDDKKAEFVIKELGFDECFNYKKEKPKDALKRLAPDGLDIYYENVGGETLEAALDSMKDFGRIICSGMISQYNLPPEEAYPIRNTYQIVGKRLKVQGFIVTDPGMGPKYFAEHQEKMQKWIADGTFKAKLSITEGIDKAGEGLLGMFKGENFGKAILKVADLQQ